MIATGVNVGLGEWIIEGTSVLSSFYWRIKTDLIISKGDSNFFSFPWIFISFFFFYGKPFSLILLSQEKPVSLFVFNVVSSYISSKEAVIVDI